MENIFDTSKLKANGARPLPGWIVGTAGAVRYPLPFGAPRRPRPTSTGICWPQSRRTAQFNSLPGSVRVRRSALGAAALSGSAGSLVLRSQFAEQRPDCQRHNADLRGAINRHQQRPAALTNGALLPSGFFPLPVTAPAPCSSISSNSRAGLESRHDACSRLQVSVLACMSMVRMPMHESRFPAKSAYSTDPP